MKGLVTERSVGVAEVFGIFYETRGFLFALRLALRFLFGHEKTFLACQPIGR